MRFHLFIGHHKVGSTALQTYLAQNARALAAHGVLYPGVEPEGIAALDRDPGPDSGLSLNRREPHNGLAFRMLEEAGYMPVPPYHPGLPDSDTMLGRIADQIDRFAPDHVILCAEVFANFGRADPALIARLGRFLAGQQVTVLATLRRPDDYLVSWQGQRLKFGHALLPLSAGGLDQYADDIHLDYRQMLLPWRVVFPRAHWSVEDYAQVRHDGGAVTNFLRRTEIDLPEGMVAEPLANPSLAPGVHELVRRFNRELGRPQAAAMRARLLQVCAGLSLPRSADVEMFGADVRAALARAFAPSGDWLASLSNGEIRYSQAELNRLRPLPEATAAQITLAAVLPLLDQPGDAVLAARVRDQLAEQTGA